MSDLQEQFHQAVAAADYATVNKLVFEVNVNARDAMGETALHSAMRTAMLADVMQLLDAGANPNQPDHEGITPFMVAVNATKFDNAGLGLGYKANVNFQPTSQSLPPLYHAMNLDSANGTTTRTTFLLTHGADIDKLIMLPDGSKMTLGAYALQCDAKLGVLFFERLIKNHLNRDVRAELAAGTARRQRHDTITFVLSCRIKADGLKFKLAY